MKSSFFGTLPEVIRLEFVPPFSLYQSLPQYHNELTHPYPEALSSPHRVSAPSPRFFLCAAEIDTLFRSAVVTFTVAGSLAWVSGQINSNVRSSLSLSPTKESKTDLERSNRKPKRTWDSKLLVVPTPLLERESRLRNVKRSL